MDWDFQKYGAQLLATWRRYPVKMTLLGLFVVQQIWLLLPPASDAALFADVPAVPKPIENLRLYGTRPQDGTTVWDGHSGAVLARYPDIKKILALSPNGKQLLLPGGTVFDQETGRKVVLEQYAEHVKEIKGYLDEDFAKFSPDGKIIARLVSNYPDHQSTPHFITSACFWSSQTGGFMGCSDRVASPPSGDFSPDSQRFVLGAYLEEKGLLWDILSQKTIAKLESFGRYSPLDWIVAETHGSDLGHSHWNAASFSPDGKFILLAGADNGARVYDGQTGKPLHRLSGPLFSPWYKHLWFIEYGQFVAGGRRILTTSLDGRISLWDTETGKLKDTFWGYSLLFQNTCYPYIGNRILKSGPVRTIDNVSFAADCLTVNQRYVYMHKNFPRNQERLEKVYAYDLAKHTITAVSFQPTAARLKITANGQVVPLQISEKTNIFLQNFEKEKRSSTPYLATDKLGGLKLTGEVWDRESLDFQRATVSLPFETFTETCNDCFQLSTKCRSGCPIRHTKANTKLLDVETGDIISTLYEELEDDPTFIFWPQP